MSTPNYMDTPGSNPRHESCSLLKYHHHPRTSPISIWLQILSTCGLPSPNFKHKRIFLLLGFCYKLCIFSLFLSFTIGSVVACRWRYCFDLRGMGPQICLACIFLNFVIKHMCASLRCRGRDFVPLFGKKSSSNAVRTIPT